MCTCKTTLGNLADAWGSLCMHMLDNFYMPLRSSLRLTRLTFGSLHSLAHMVVLVVDIVRVLGICPGLQEIAPHCLGVDCQLGQITDQFHPACSWVCVPARVLCTPGSLTMCNGCPGAQGLAWQSGPLGVSHCPLAASNSFEPNSNQFEPIRTLSVPWGLWVNS